MSRQERGTAAGAVVGDVLVGVRMFAIELTCGAMPCSLGF